MKKVYEIMMSATLALTFVVAAQAQQTTQKPFEGFSIMGPATDDSPLIGRSFYSCANNATFDTATVFGGPAWDIDNKNIAGSMLAAYSPLTVTTVNANAVSGTQTEVSIVMKSSDSGKVLARATVNSADLNNVTKLQAAFHLRTTKAPVPTRGSSEKALHCFEGEPDHVNFYDDEEQQIYNDGASIYYVRNGVVVSSQHFSR